jgi:hypothetical protein
MKILSNGLCATVVKWTFHLASTSSKTIWMLFTAFFPCPRFKAALPRTGQWFTNLGIPVEDQKSKVGYFDEVALTLGRRPYPLLLLVPPLLLDIEQRSFSNRATCRNRTWLMLRAPRLFWIPARPIFSPRRPYQSHVRRHQTAWRAPLLRLG